MNMRRRVERLEAKVCQQANEYEEAISRRVLSRLTDSELDAYEAALVRVIEEKEPAEDD